MRMREVDAQRTEAVSAAQGTEGGGATGRVPADGQVDQVAVCAADRSDLTRVRQNCGRN